MTTEQSPDECRGESICRRVDSHFRSGFRALAKVSEQSRCESFHLCRTTSNTDVVIQHFAQLNIRIINRFLNMVCHTRRFKPTQFRLEEYLRCPKSISARIHDVTVRKFDPSNCRAFLLRLFFGLIEVDGDERMTFF